MASAVSKPAGSESYIADWLNHYLAAVPGLGLLLGTGVALPAGTAIDAAATAQFGLALPDLGVDGSGQRVNQLGVLDLLNSLILHTGKQLVATRTGGTVTGVALQARQQPAQSP